ncbi:DHA2 family efflux MFS transporter permease subunit [Candidatus Solirubrobacter pratensis]|uniref:DHA2 family efflux MFS transporter permease subunit n=1 Tax=Candidatus Solirubrobacter pratensis TaxID=1298857 RepID=UPI00041B0D81|nr:DHA2 family efflux MFS transporter permease subunit [Candidatus Solirubrobacter pratensis]
MTSSPANRAAAPDPRMRALVVLCAGMLMVILDQTIVNVALPSIQSDLGFTQSGLAWVVNAYLIAFGGLLLLAGRLGDLLGRKRLFMAGMAVFTLASLACGLAGSQGMLIAARFVQGVGGALSSAVILGMIVTMFPQPGEQAKAIGIYSFVASAGASIGLLSGGVLTQALDWHWIFFVNVPIGVATLALAVPVVAADRGLGLREGADGAGAALVTGALMLGVYAIVGVADHGWGSAQTLGLGAISLALLGAFVWREATAATPLLPLRIFRSRNVTGANAVQTLLVSGALGMFFLAVLYLQRVLGFDALETGLAFLPVSVVIGTLSLGFSARLNLRFGAKAVLVPGMALVALGLAWLTQVSVDGAYVVDVLPAMLLMGAGAGISFPALMTLAMSGATAEDSGLASGLVNTTQQVGGAIGISLLVTFATSRTDSLRAAGETTASALTGGYRLAFAISAGLALAGALLAATVLRRESEARAEISVPEAELQTT